MQKYLISTKLIALVRSCNRKMIVSKMFLKCWFYVCPVGITQKKVKLFFRKLFTCIIFLFLPLWKGDRWVIVAYDRVVCDMHKYVSVIWVILFFESVLFESNGIALKFHRVRKWCIEINFNAEILICNFISSEYVYIWLFANNMLRILTWDIQCRAKIAVIKSQSTMHLLIKDTQTH